MNTMDTSNWENFKYAEIFEIKKGKRLTKEDFIKGNTPFIGSIDSNNGYRDFIGQEPIHEGNTITVNYNGSVGEAFYQPKPFWASDDVNVLYPKFRFNKYIAMFVIPLIKKEKYRFNYGRKWESKRMKESIIKLPKNQNKEVDVDFMENYIKSLPNSKIIENKYSDEISSSYSTNKIILDIKEWSLFSLENLFTIKGSKTTSIMELIECGEGHFPYVTTQASNNGIEGFYNYYSEEGNVLTIDSAVIGYSSYQELNFSASDHVEKLIPKFKMSKYVALFIVTILNLEQYRYNYGRKCSQVRLKDIKIKLPSKNGEPDFDFMEKYIKSLPYSSSI